MVASGPLVTVAGPGGVGKTRLVAEMLRDLPGDVVVAELGWLHARADVGAIVGQLGFDAVEGAVAALAHRNATVVLDNCEHVLDAVRRFVDLALGAGDGVRVLATSREPLARAGEHVLRLGPLPPEEASELYLDRARAAGAAQPEAGAVARLCEALDAIPLAIELAAARAPALGPGDFLRDVEQRLDLLAGPSGAAARHDSVRAAIDVSVDLLDEDERALFERVGVFAGPFDVDLVQSLIGTSSPRAVTLDRVGRLAQRSLLVAEPDDRRTRYRLLELVREYAYDRLVQSGAAPEAQRMFVDAMAGFADGVVTEAVEHWSGDLIGRITAQYPNLAAAIDWCVDHDADPGRAFRLLLPLFAVVHEGRALEVLALGAQALARWPDAGAPRRAEALAVLAVAAVFAGDDERALLLAGASLRDEGSTGMASFLAERAIGFALRNQGDLAGARQHFAAGRARAEALGVAPFARELAGLEAATLDALGDRVAAVPLARDALAAAAAAGDRLNEAWLHLVLSAIGIRGGELRAARAELERAREAVAALGVPWWQGAMHRLGAVLAAERGWQRSRPLWRAALEHAVDAGSVGEVAHTLRTAAVVAERHGEHAVALALLDAVPTSGSLTVIPELFPEERAALDRARSGSVAPPDLVSAWRRAAAVLDGEAPRDPAPSGSAAPPGARLRRDGDVWELTFGGRTVTVRDLKGIGDLAVLVARRGQEVHALELVGGAVIGDAGEVLDSRARREYEARIVELQRESEDARANNDPVRAERAEAELDVLVTQLADAFGLGGRARAKGSSAERARTTVAYRIRSAVRRITQAHPDLGRHLRNSVRTGMWCSYAPEQDVEWDVEA